MEKGMGPLTGIRVVELGMFSPPRLATRWLALLGAEVISIERPPKQRSREWKLLDDDTHSHWNGYQTNKLSMMLNIKSPKGREVLLRLVERADVFVEGHKPGTMARAGADFESLSAINPRLIYCSISSFGQTGPYAHMGGHDSNYQAMGGILARTSASPETLGDGTPVLAGLVAGDHLGGSAMAVIAILAALWHRQSSGRGQHLDVACAQGLIGAMGRRYADEFWSSGDLTARGVWNNLDGHPGYGVYGTRDGRYVTISAVEPWAWEKFCRTVGRVELIEQAIVPDASFYKANAKTAELRRSVADIFRTRTMDEWWALNQREDLCITPVLEPDEVLNDPHFVEWGAFAEVEHPKLGKIRQVALPFKMSDSPGAVRSMPSFGGNTNDVLGELNYSKSQIDELRELGAIG
jgi:crotonobetainyl-CoA:carnitine CoA-transferase CaiB-like acyl-CoA transferase